MKILVGDVMAWSWYGVKSLYRSEATGKPDKTDKDYNAQATLVEERVVLFQARNFTEAIRKAEKEAKAYADETEFENLYGQRVRMKYLECCDAFEMFDPPAAGVEIYSATEVVSRNVTNSVAVNRRMGEKETAKVFRKRKKFFNRELAERFYRKVAAEGEI